MPWGGDKGESAAPRHGREPLARLRLHRRLGLGAGRSALLRRAGTAWLLLLRGASPALLPRSRERRRARSRASAGARDRYAAVATRALSRALGSRARGRGPGARDAR